MQQDETIKELKNINKTLETLTKNIVDLAFSIKAIEHILREIPKELNHLVNVEKSK